MVRTGNISFLGQTNFSNALVSAFTILHNQTRGAGMKSNRRSFIRTLTAAGVGAAGLRVKGLAAAQQHLPPMIGGSGFQVPRSPVRPA
jgi:hypothetical protein